AFPVLIFIPSNISADFTFIFSREFAYSLYSTAGTGGGIKFHTVSKTDPRILRNSGAGAFRVYSPQFGLYTVLGIGGNTRLGICGISNPHSGSNIGTGSVGNTGCATTNGIANISLSLFHLSVNQTKNLLPSSLASLNPSARLSPT